MKFLIVIIRVEYRIYQIGILTPGIAVEPQVFNLIIYLVEDRNKIVSRNEILKKVWRDRIVSDTPINSHIKLARKALGDGGAKQHIM